MAKYIKVEDIEKYLLDAGELRSLNPLSPCLDMTKDASGKIGHGSCCTCQTCGWHYDDCVCYANKNLEIWKEFVEQHAKEIKD